MNANCSNLTETAMAPSSAENQPLPLDGNPDRATNFLYQAATVLAILLFLVSF